MKITEIAKLYLTNIIDRYTNKHVFHFSFSTSYLCKYYHYILIFSLNNNFWILIINEEGILMPPRVSTQRCGYKTVLHLQHCQCVCAIVLLNWTIINISIMKHNNFNNTNFDLPSDEYYHVSFLSFVYDIVCHLFAV